MIAVIIPSKFNDRVKTKITIDIIRGSNDKFETHSKVDMATNSWKPVKYISKGFLKYQTHGKAANTKTV